MMPQKPTRLDLQFQNFMRAGVQPPKGFMNAYNQQRNMPGMGYGRPSVLPMQQNLFQPMLRQMLAPQG